jgi:hypothetical protein
VGQFSYMGECTSQAIRIRGRLRLDPLALVAQGPGFRLGLAATSLAALLLLR